MKKYSTLIMGILTLLLCLTSVQAANTQTWSSWVADLRQEAVTDGIRPEVFDEAFSRIHEPSHQVLSLDRHQPEHRLTYLEYRSSRGDTFRINMGVRKFNQNRALLEEIGKAYGVNPCVITSLWGIESSYGAYMGNFPTIQALATLAYDDRRSNHFRHELLLALHIVNEGQVSLADYKGEWAGASGQCQFMPSSWYQYAVDYDHTGRKDIWKNLSDVFASIANYLVKNGWQAGQPWGVQVEVPDTLDPALVGLKISKPISEWETLGVKIQSNQQQLAPTLMASLIEPDGGPNYLVFNNFKVIMHYNNSIFYAGTVSYMADQICTGTNYR